MKQSGKPDKFGKDSKAQVGCSVAVQTRSLAPYHPKILQSAKSVVKVALLEHKARKSA